MEERIEISDPRWLLNQKVSQELQWWKEEIIPETKVAQALASGKLVRVPNTGNGYRLIYTLRSEKEPPLARPETVLALTEIGSTWQAKIDASPVKINPRSLFLSVSSLYRGEELQRKLLQNNPNSALLSSHQAGASIDIDPLGFYWREQEEFVAFSTTNPQGLPLGFIFHLSDCLRSILLAMEQENLINFIPEYESRQTNKSTLSCFHICVNPQIQLLSKQGNGRQRHIRGR